jgi:tetratricopeptide (TPR) repeat protein
MKFANLLKITDSPLLSTLIWILLLLATLYFARKPFQRAVMSLSKVIKNAMRLSSAAVLAAENKLVRRNREVLIAAGIENAERMVEREFDRINTAVERDLESYPNLHRQLSGLITRLDEDYSKSTDVPPSLPNWIPMIESIAKIKHSGDSMVSNMLAEINRTLTEQHNSAVEIYRNSIASRHNILSKMLPHWRKIQKITGDIGKSLSILNDRAKTIDRYMDDYEQIRAQTDNAVRKLSSSSLTQFFIAGIVLLIAFGGALINFNLIALPMSEMVGGASYIGPYKTSDVAGLVIILIELTMGLFLMESLRITRLFPIIGSMDDKMRHRMIWITFTMLTILAGVESALAFMRDRIALDIETLRQTLAGVEQTTLTASMIPTVGQMIMGFILPFALAFVAIPLESFIASSRTVLGIIGAGLLRIIAFILRLLGSASHYFGRFILSVYDLVIFPTIWLEGVVIGIGSRVKTPPKHEIEEENPEEEPEMIENVDQTLK